MSNYLWDKSGDPDPEVQRLEELLVGFRAPGREAPVARRRWLRPALATAAVALAAAAALIVMLRPRPPVQLEPGWKVDSLAGAPRCGDGACGELRPGEWLETDGTGRARLAVADIGHMDVEPGSRLRLVRTARDGHRLELRRGTLSAKVDAPPRLLIVDTPATTAVDLGCAYTLGVQADGATRIEVTSGWVALESPGWSTIVPAGAVAMARPGGAPSVPVMVDAPDALRVAAFAPGGAPLDGSSVKIILAQARRRDAVTVWNLVSRVGEGAQREQVVARLAELVPPPQGASCDAAERLDPGALEAWRGALAPPR